MSTSERGVMKRVLVAYGSKHGATAEIAEAIAEELRASGLAMFRLPSAGDARGQRLYAFRGREAGDRWHDFFADTLPALEAAGWRVEIAEDFGTRLIEQGLVDQFELAIIPIVLGQGLSIFGGLTQPRRLTLISSKAFPKGTVVQVYRPA